MNALSVIRVSIESKKLMLNQFCQENGFSIFDYYVDDDFSGLHFQRPGFQKMPQDMEERIRIMPPAVSLLLRASMAPGMVMCRIYKATWAKSLTQMERWLYNISALREARC